MSDPQRSEESVRWYNGEATSEEIISQINVYKNLDLECDPEETKEQILWRLLEEIDAQIDLAEEISPEFAEEVEKALWS
jgi:hypothetical protein